MIKGKPYRKNAGIVVFNAKGKVLAGERSDHAGIFQLPQGGIDSNETPLVAARRELKEETGLILKNDPISEIQKWLTYEFPKDIPQKLQNYRGQKQKWFFFFWDGDVAKLSYKNHDEMEFRSLGWYDLKEICQKAVSFKKTVYQKIYEEGQKVITSYLKLHYMHRWGGNGNDIKRVERLPKSFDNFLENTFDLQKNKFLEQQYSTKSPRDISPSSFTKKQIEELSNITGKENVAIDTFSRLSHSYGQFFLDVFNQRQGNISHLPDAVVYPRSEKEISQIIRWCNKKSIPIVVCGKRSSVTQSLKMPKGGISLDLTRHYTKVIHFSKINSSITVEPGITGPELESYLNARGFTSGHFPQSFEYSTVGGWVAARGAGQASTSYGTIAEIVLGLCLSTSKGQIKTKDYPTASIGPEIQRLLIGSEGALGILTSVTLRIRAFDKNSSTMASFVFKDFTSGTATMKQVMQGQFGFPHFFRLQDSDESDFSFRLTEKRGGWGDRFLTWKGYTPQKRCLLHMVSYGDHDLQKLIRSKCKAIARHHGGLYLGSFPVKQWLQHRYSSAHLRDSLLDRGLAIDTVETVTSWENVNRLRNAVRKKILQRPKTICLSHISHAYENGANLYFIFLTKLKKGKEKEDFQPFHDSILDTIQENKGAISHHHGIGRLFSSRLEEEIGPLGVTLLRAIKTNVDPKNIFNPSGTWGN